MNLEEIIQDLLAQKAAGTNKEKMNIVLDNAIEHIKALAALTPDQKVNLQIVKLESLVDQKDDVIIQLQQELQEAQEIAADALAKYNETAERLPVSLEVSVSGKKVKINHGVHYKGDEFTAAELAKNNLVLEELLKIGSGALTILED